MDAFGNLSSVYEPDPTTGSPSTGPATHYAYNGANQLTNVYLTLAGVAQNRTFTYNGSEMLAETTPEAGTVTYTYDSNHHVLTRTDAKGQQTKYSYDSYERLTEVQHWTPTGTNNALVEQLNQRVDYAYDSAPIGGYGGPPQRRRFSRTDLRQPGPRLRL
jgi:YD repeat-containing protein